MSVARDETENVLPHRRRPPRRVRTRPQPSLDEVPTPVAPPDERLPFSPARKRAAEHLVDSKATSAHATCMVEVDYTAVHRARRPAGLTALPYVARAAMHAFADFPVLNATVAGGVGVPSPSVHLGIAVDLEHQALVVPVLHDAEALPFDGLASGIADLAERARARRLRPDDVVGGTFTITNPGPFGTFRSVPIINQPQVAILATDVVRRRPVVTADPAGHDTIAVRPIGNLALSFDARVVSLDEAAGYLARVRDLLES